MVAAHSPYSSNVILPLSSFLAAGVAAMCPNILYRGRSVRGKWRPSSWSLTRIVHTSLGFKGRF
jgi:hypothetical protein